MFLGQIEQEIGPENFVHNRQKKEDGMHFFRAKKASKFVFFYKT
jgi:hypothetical protein